MKSTVLLGLTGLAAVTAHPHIHSRNDGGKDAVTLGKRGVNLDQYLDVPSLGSYTKAEAVSNDAPSVSGSDYIQVATDLVKKTFPDLTFRVVDDHYVGSNGIGHVNFIQTIHGIDVDNGNFHVNVAANGKVFSHGNSFFTGSLPEKPASRKRDSGEPVDALRAAVSTLNLPVQVSPDAAVSASLTDTDDVYTITGVSGTTTEPKARLVYRQDDATKVTLTWRIETDVVDNWLLSYVDAETSSEVLGVVDYVADVSYEVYPWHTSDPSQGERVIEQDPWLLEASQFGWISDGKTNYTTTRGNNAIAQINHDGGDDYLNNYRPDSPELAFQYPYSLTEADYKKYVDASISQLFFTANKFHDLLYLLGFTEAAGNFQANNNGKGGREGDHVILNAQDGSGMNNANFATPPDGQNGRMRMYIWNASTPWRDCSFDASVVLHEYTHGLSTRLTGGPAVSGCLSGTIPGGLGEGWSDFFAVGVGLKPNHTRSTVYPMAPWISNKPLGIRPYPYATDFNVNPHTYKDIVGLTKVHYVGTVWCTMLYEILWNLIDKHGKNDNDFPTLDDKGKPDDGRFLALKIVHDAFELQPCRPNFVSARDAILDSDLALTGGENKCEIWAGFAKRGLGPKATASPVAEDFETHADCK